ncbi:transposase [Actinomadura darangshiensis]|uniref:Transposase n=1 Tax=Actinomadura darangshiensis TaxID=705336 RepID=A0A4R5BFD7_9ACTN|nr:transposase [Actinomadura darangshiensis]
MQVKLVPDAVQVRALERTLRTVNQCANRVSAGSFEAYGLKGSVKDLRSMAYGDLKARGLGAQAAQHVIKRVADAYTTLRASIRAGNLGPEGCKRRRKAESKEIVFRADAAHTYDDRCVSWNYDAQTVSIWTMDGRLKNVRFACSATALKRLTQYRRGESDLMVRNGKWFLIATCEVPEAERYEPNDWIGVDRGINNLATTSDGDNHCGRRLDRYRRRQARKRAEIQAKRTRSAAQLLKRRARRESRHATHTNHKISKTVVAVAYKARRAGVPFIEVDPAYTSQRCPRCGHTARNNRPTRDHFCCRRCGLAGPADVVAGVNVRDRARSAWVFVNMPPPAPT